MRNRVDKLGVSEPEIRKQPPDQIVIQLPAVHDVNQAASIIGQTAQLELYDMETSLVPPSIDASQNPVAFDEPLQPARRACSPGRRACPRSTGSSTRGRRSSSPGPYETLAQLKRSPRSRRSSR